MCCAGVCSILSQSVVFRNLKQLSDCHGTWGVAKRMLGYIVHVHCTFIQTADSHTHMYFSAKNNTFTSISGNSRRTYMHIV